ncbi:DUF6531 domain-containing protein [uncultured Thiodictyon sp.]|uniref:DUF6531 domain-containing protein n=1 Tax=uncultured Thiodictyon sp. TaxID=1846217 RepID=UPI0025FB44D3|nr:DUF6531 domain-containing protein [uncultured Thiodictyon sp.]
MVTARARLLLACLLPLWLWAGLPAALASGGANAPTAAEAILDDPGLDPGTGSPLGLGGAGDDPVRIGSARLDLTNTAAGAHTLYLRVQDQAGRWSATLGQGLMVTADPGGVPLPAGVVNTLQTAEAYLDQDPGPGRGTPLAAADGAFNSSLELVLRQLDLHAVSGNHTLFVRTRDAAGLWSAAIGQSFRFTQSAPGTLPAGGYNRVEAAEAFIDRDPGQGHGIPLATAADGAIDSAMETLSGRAVLNTLAPGVHVLNLRLRDSTGTWSPATRQTFFVTARTALAGEAGPTWLVAAQGRVDGGSPSALPADDGAFGDVVETATLTQSVVDGYHSAGIRFQDSRGQWSEISTGTGIGTGTGTGNCRAFGRLLDGATNGPLAGVTISAGGLTVTTDAAGQFSLVGLACTPQVVTVTVPGYESYQRSWNPAGGGWWDIQLTRPAVANGLMCQSGFASDPVNTATGNYVYQRLDLAIPGNGLPLRFERTYNSREASTPGAPGGPLGAGWTHSYRIAVSQAAGVATITWGDGHTETYTPDGRGGYTPQYGVFDTLSDQGAGAFSLLRRDRTRYDFDNAGRLTAIADRNGNTLTLGYAGANLTQIIDTAGRTIAFNYDGSGRLIQVTDPSRRTLRYAYDGNGDLSTATDPRGQLTRYTYDGQHQILSVIDPRGHRVVNNGYDAQRRVVTYQTDAKGGATAYSYQETDRVTTITDALGGVMVHRHDELLRLIRAQDANGAQTAYRYDALGNRTQVTDKNGHLTEYGYDARGNVTSKRDALGQVTAISYDSDDNPLTRTDALGGVTQFIYDTKGNLTASIDALGNRSSVTYSGNGLPLTVTDPLGRTATFAYDAAGNLTAATDAASHVTTFGYDTLGRRLTVTDALGRTTTSAYDAGDQLITQTDAAGKTLTFDYDPNGNRVGITDRLGRTTVFAYDEKDLLVSTTDALGAVQRATYDALDRRVALTDPLGAVTRYGYDAVGQLLEVTDPLGGRTVQVHDANGNTLRVTDPNGNTTSSVYDARNRPIRMTDALGQVTEIAYDALDRPTRVTDAAGHSGRRWYDALGRLTAVADAAGGRIAYGYNAVGKRVTMTDPNGHTTTYTYDAGDRLVQQIAPGGAVTLNDYDAVGHRIRVTRPDGRPIQYGYDALDRLASIAYPGGSNVTLTYDAVGNLLTMADGVGSSRYVYDALDRRIAATDPFGQTMGYSYDAAGRRTALTYPGGRPLTYGYDAAGRLTGLTDWLGNRTVYAYDPGGRLVSAALPNGVATTYGYDAADRLTALAHRRGTTLLAGYTYTLDALGNHLSVDQTDTLAPALIAATTANTVDADNRLTLTGGLAYGYDTQGNLTGRGGEALAWDGADRLIQSGTGAGRTTYRYDGLGRRLERIRGGTATRYLLDTAGSLSQVMAETDGAGQPRAWYVSGLGLVSRIGADGSVRYYLPDARGSTAALTDGTGQVTDTYAYDPFGAQSRATGSTPNPFRYIGRYGLMDDGGGLLYVRARYYEPATGRFLSQDPKPGADDDGQSLHRYVYAMNNPVRLIDVSGLSAREGIPSSSSWSSSGGPDFPTSSDMAHDGLLTNLYEDSKKGVGIVDTITAIGSITKAQGGFLYASSKLAKRFKKLNRKTSIIGSVVTVGEGIAKVRSGEGSLEGQLLNVDFTLLTAASPINLGAAVLDLGGAVVGLDVNISGTMSNLQEAAFDPVVRDRMTNRGAAAMQREGTLMCAVDRDACGMSAAGHFIWVVGTALTSE